MEIEQLIIQLLGNSPTLIAVLLIYWRLDRRILINEIKIMQLQNGRNKKNGSGRLLES